jgi:hypothetical protein
MKLVDIKASMPTRRRIVCAGFTAALVLASTAPTLAGRQISAADVARLLTGRKFQIECVDGTTGHGQVSRHGVASVVYRRPSAPRGQPAEYDNAVVRVRDGQICLAWRQFAGGGDGCYPVSEEATGRYRLSSGPLWCDIRTK